MMLGFKAQFLVRMEVFLIYSTHKAFMNPWCTETSIERLTLSLTWNDAFSEEIVYLSLKVLNHFMFQLNFLSM